MVERFLRSILPPCTGANVGPNHSRIPCRRFDSVPGHHVQQRLAAMQAVFVGGRGRLLLQRALRERKRATALSWRHGWTRACGSQPRCRVGGHRHSGSSQAAIAAHGRSGSLVDNFCIVDHPPAGTHGVPLRKSRPRPHRLATGKSGPPEPGLCASRPAMPGRSAPRRGARRYHAPSVLLRDDYHSYTRWHGCCFAMPRTTFREAAMDEDLKQDIAGSTQRLLADRLRQRYARCRETLAGYASEADAPPAAIRTPLRLTVVQKDPASPQRHPTGSGERFATLFSQAYSAARDSRDHAPAPMPRRNRQRVTA